MSVDVEPSFLALGPFNLVCGMNNRAWFYAFTDNGLDATCNSSITCLLKLT